MSPPASSKTRGNCHFGKPGSASSGTAAAAQLWGCAQEGIGKDPEKPKRDTKGAAITVPVTEAITPKYTPRAPYLH
jgi:hypothetical protein